MFRFPDFLNRWFFEENIRNALCIGRLLSCILVECYYYNVAVWPLLSLPQTASATTASDVKVCPIFVSQCCARCLGQLGPS